jgi:23S rRNA pseudouridine2605 synthase
VSGVRLQRALAAAGVASRRGADALIEAGRVTVDGRVAAVGERVEPERQRIEVDGEPIGSAETAVYLALSKPAGVTSTVSDPHAARTVLDLVPPDIARSARLYPVGRLDRDSEGLLLLTNDGAFADRVLHPRYGVEREYAAAVDAQLAPEAITRLRDGVRLSDGVASVRAIRPTTPAELRDVARTFGDPVGGLAWYRVILGEGRKREVRRLFAAVGATVRRLIRVRIGPLSIDGLEPGRVRMLTDREVAALADASQGAGSERR